MTLVESILLGILQGLTEFLPISSDGHLAIASHFFDLQADPQSQLGFDVLLHVGSLLALLLCYARTWIRLLCAPFRRDRDGMMLLLLLIIATIPGVIAGLLLEDMVATTLRTVTAAAIGFLITAFFLLIGEWIAVRARGELRDVRLVGAVMIGCAQAFAILPGVSRSGLTIATGRMLGLTRRSAMDFSFLMAAPIIGGAVVFIGREIVQGAVVLPPLPITLAGLTASFIASVLAIRFLLRWVRMRSLAWFALYLIPLSVALLFIDWHAEWVWDPVSIEIFLQKYGSIGVFIFALLETVPPISFFSPGIVALILAGAVINSIPTAILFFAAGVLGLVAGNTIFFSLGRKAGRPIAAHLYITHAQLEMADRFMRRFGKAGVFLGQFLGAIRPLAAIVAGTIGFSRGTFYIWMLAGGACYIALLLLGGALFRSQLEWILPLLGLGGIVTLIFFAIIALVAQRHLKPLSSASSTGKIDALLP